MNVLGLFLKQLFPGIYPENAKCIPPQMILNFLDQLERTSQISFKFDWFVGKWIYNQHWALGKPLCTTTDFL